MILDRGHRCKHDSETNRGTNHAATHEQTPTVNTPQLKYLLLYKLKTDVATFQMSELRHGAQLHS
jgi:hypothetical protein